MPFRDIFEALGLTVAWDASTRTVTGTKEGKTIQLFIGSNIAIVDGQTVSLDAPPVVVKGTTLAPLRFVAEASGLKVQWDGAKNQVLITASGGGANTGGGSASTGVSSVNTGGSSEEKYLAAMIEVEADCEKLIKQLEEFEAALEAIDSEQGLVAWRSQHLAAGQGTTKKIITTLTASAEFAPAEDKESHAKALRAMIAFNDALADLDVGIDAVLSGDESALDKALDKFLANVDLAYSLMEDL